MISIALLITLDILNIDHLWMLKGLVKLTLSHNVIERIESLDELVHLRELDLSFNRIKVMENLNNLEQLEILLLFRNEIAIVQGIDNLSKLTILNIGKNKITDWEHVCIWYIINFFFIFLFDFLLCYNIAGHILTRLQVSTKFKHVRQSLCRN